MFAFRSFNRGLRKIVMSLSCSLILSLGFSSQSAQIPRKDTPFPKQKALFEKLHVLEAWQLTKGSSDVLVGVIDNGFDFFHPEKLAQFFETAVEAVFFISRERNHEKDY